MADFDVVIVGAGPVGLLAALAAVDAGLRPRVYERRTESRRGSRSIGVHPPSLEILDRLGLFGRFSERAILVRRGHAVGTKGQLGVIDFGACRGRHRYIMTIPQVDTEHILRQALEERAPGVLVTGTSLDSLWCRDDGVRLGLRDDHGHVTEVQSPALVACDGKHSGARAAAGIEAPVRTYAGSYAMADFPDTTQWGADAAVYLTERGLVESFPLPGRLRRWVLRRDEGARGDVTPQEIVDTIADRTKHRLAAADAASPSDFRAERHLASRLSWGPVAFAGDAAHVVSPIGGQGMNLGWIGAVDLIRTIAKARRERLPIDGALREDAARRARSARAVARRAEINMWIGRPTHHHATRDRLVEALLGRPVVGVLANVFTMRGLGFGV